MPRVTAKPLVWLLEEATPDVALLMHQIERTAAGQADVRRVTYTEALRELPRALAHAPLAAIVVFSVTNLQNLAALVKGLPQPQPRLCFWPPNFEAVALLRHAGRWPEAVCVVARHAGEAAVLASAGFRPEAIVRVQGDVVTAALSEADGPRPLRVGCAWYNMAQPQRDQLVPVLKRWLARQPEACEWHVFCLPGDEPPEELLQVVRVSSLIAAAGAVETPLALDVWLTDPWWPEAFPRPWTAPVVIPLPPGGVLGRSDWVEALQALLDLGEPSGWHEDLLWSWASSHVWRLMLRAEGADEPRAGELAAGAAPDLAPLVHERTRWQAWLDQARQAWPHRLEDPHFDAELAYYFWLYDYRVEVSWSHALWSALQQARDGERHAVLMALNALRLHHTGGSWLFKRLLARTPLGRPPAGPRRLGWPFWLRFALGRPWLLLAFARELWFTGRDPEADPMRVGREVARAALETAAVQIVRRNEPAPLEGLPTIYLVSHRHGDLDPFLLLHALPQRVAVVVGPRAQRWPLINRLSRSPSFVLTGRERGVVIADAIASVRANLALALYPEVTEPSYLGEGAPARSGLLWILQALEHVQLIPVLLDDAFLIGPGGGQVDLWFGPPLTCNPETSATMLNRVRMFFHRHVQRINALDEGPPPPSA
ncbi:MAG: hypothetical protein VKS61_16995 [Candidatus Sericytochromatia bacterium]|nr:hypothetical protein [Candidatus Sericytochromatia bacterium]